MIQFLLKFLGVKIDAAQEVTSVSLQLRHGDWLGSTVFIALLVAAFAWAVYRYVGGHKELAPARRRWLTGLRLALFSLLLFILLRPVFSFTVENRLRRTFIALLDKSASMEIEDLPCCCAMRPARRQAQETTVKGRMWAAALLMPGKTLSMRSKLICRRPRGSTPPKAILDSAVRDGSRVAAADSMSSSIVAITFPAPGG